MMLEIDDLHRRFQLGHGLFRPRRQVHAVNGVSVTVAAGECLGVVGESGSGKSTLGRLALGLIAPSAGRVRALGQDLAALKPEARRRLRRDLALVHQNPRAALDPRWTVGAQVAEPLAIHEPGLGARAREEARAAAFAAVGLGEPLAARYPHQLSGGQRQRVVLARALILRPKFVVMDEPTSALDVSVQAQVMQVIAEMKQRLALTYLFISHDLRNLRRIADRIAVMYAGRIVEIGPAGAVCTAPAHPYTRALLAAVPSLTRRAAASGIVGEPPDPAHLPAGCAFHPRCPRAEALCRTAAPLLMPVGDGRGAACHFAAATPTAEATA